MSVLFVFLGVCMGLNVEKSLDVLYNKELVGVKYNFGNEYILKVRSKSGRVKRVRIPAKFKQFLEQYRGLKDE